MLFVRLDAATWVAIASACASCRGGRGGSGPPPPQPGPAPAVIEGPLADLPEDLKANDLRLTPPQIESLHVRRADDGSTIVEVALGKDPRLARHVTIPLLAGHDGQGGEAPRLRDDGQGGDAVAGDGVFSLPRPVPFDEVRVEQERMRAEAARAKITTILRFDGRHVVAERPLPRILDPDRFELLHSLPGFVDAQRSLFVTAPQVVEDPTRTAHPCTGAGTPMGVWTFGHVMRELAGGVAPEAFTSAFFSQMKVATAVEVNGLIAPGRDVDKLLDIWPRRPDGALDLARAPMKLLAIVNRIDLAGNASYGRVGGAEGRLIFQAMDPRTPDCKPLATRQVFLVIFEYGVPRTSCDGLADWARAWKALGGLPLGSPAYNAALAALTEQFVRAGVAPGRPNGSAINQVRTNDAAFDGRWELREFRLTDAGLRAVSVRQTPDLTFNGARSGARAADLAAWINARPSAILAGRHTVTDYLSSGTTEVPFLGPVAKNHEVRKLAPGPAEEPVWLTSLWRASGIATSELRHRFSVGTCDGCHGRETETTFVHVGSPERGTRLGEAAILSGFLTGITVRDPDDPALEHRFSDLTRRAAVLQDFSESDCLRPFPKPPLAQGEHRVPMPPLAVRPMLGAH